MVNFVGVKTYYYTLLSSPWAWHLLHRKPASTGTSHESWHAQEHSIRNSIYYLLLVFFQKSLYSSYQDYHKFKKTLYSIFYRHENEHSSILQIIQQPRGLSSDPAKDKDAHWLPLSDQFICLARWMVPHTKQQIMNSETVCASLAVFFCDQQDWGGSQCPAQLRISQTYLSQKYLLHGEPAPVYPYFCAPHSISHIMVKCQCYNQ